MDKKDDLLNRATNPEQYDRQGISWKTEIGLDSPMRKFFWARIMKHCPDWQGRRVLDVGAGTGWALEEARKLGAAATVGVEPSANNLIFSRQLYPKIQMVRGPLEHYHGDLKFDRVLSVMSLPHIRNLGEAFEKIRRLLAEPAGEFVAIVPDYDYYRLQRHGYEVRIQDLNYCEYVTSIKRDLGTLVDIVRKEMAYVLAADGCGLQLKTAEPMPPSEELMEKLPKYKNYRGNVLTNFFKFTL
jgi:SAM-dependent methyltransferase